MVNRLKALSSLPTAIWMPNSTFAQLPACYQGSPLEIAQAMAEDMKPGLGVHDAIDTLLRQLQDEADLTMSIPEEAPEEVRATMLLVGLLMAGIAEPMPTA